MSSASARVIRATPIAAAVDPCANLLLARLRNVERRQLIACCVPVQLAFGDVLCEQGARIRHVYFPIRGFISLIAATDGRPRLEVGLVGSEGMLGASLLLGVKVAPLRAIVQGAGTALRMNAAHFSRQAAQHLVLRREVNSYLYVLMSQFAQLAACARFHDLDARLARWLLMTRDRAHSDQFYITQEFIAYMLGVRRVGITLAAGTLRKRKVIRYSRGNMNILDVPSLEAVSCGCYAAAKELYEQFMT
jgi:CRP-like cAMP-binding protein